MILYFDTGRVQNSQNEPETDTLWQKTQFANLVRYVPSQKLYARIRVRGKLIVKSLKTDKISVAKLRLTDLEKQERQRDETEKRVAKGKVTFSDALTVYKERLEGNPEIKPRTKDYYRERLAALLASWPDLKNQDVRNITKNDCLKWAGRFGADASPSSFNNTVAVLRQIIDIGIEFGARYENPAVHIGRRRPSKKRLQLPTQAQFEAWIKEMRNLGDGWCKMSADLVQFLSYGGFRKSEAANVTWADCDFENGQIRVFGHPEQRTKNDEFRSVPMIQEMRELLERLHSENPTALPTTPVMPVGECQGNMDRARLKLENPFPRITHHDLRHWFATRCIEAGVDIPTVSRWLGHKDGGALAMKTYGHLRDEHSSAMAAKVSFRKPANVIDLAKEAV